MHTQFSLLTHFHTVLLVTKNYKKWDTLNNCSRIRGHFSASKVKFAFLTHPCLAECEATFRRKLHSMRMMNVSTTTKKITKYYIRRDIYVSLECFMTKTYTFSKIVHLVILES